MAVEGDDCIPVDYARCMDGRRSHCLEDPAAAAWVVVVEEEDRSAGGSHMAFHCPRRVDLDTHLEVGNAPDDIADGDTLEPHDSHLDGGEARCDAAGGCGILTGCYRYGLDEARCAVVSVEIRSLNRGREDCRPCRGDASSMCRSWSNAET